jgi:hypothetical protein
MKLNTKNKAIVILTLMISLLLLISVKSFAQSSSEKIHIGLIYPLSSNGTNAPRDTNRFSLNLLGGVSAAEHGFTFAGLFNVIKQDTRGVQFAGLSNHIGKKADGAMFAGLINTYGGGKGLAAAGLGNFSKTKSGVQVAGIFNKAGDVSSLQMTGLINVASYVHGSQISGLMNIAKNVKGVQMAGLINIADTADCQIGLINISRNGEKSLAVTYDENQTAMLTFRSGVGMFYGILGIGYNFKNDKQKYAYEAGLGVHALKKGVFRLNAELSQSGLTDFKKGEYSKSSFKLLPSARIANGIELFAGPSVNYISTNTEEGKALKTKYISSWGGNDGHDFHAFYIGYTAGIQVAL